MIYLRTVEIEQLWTLAKIDPAKAPAAPQGRPAWTIVTPVRDPSVGVRESKLCKSIKDECDDVGKRSSLLVMLHELRFAVLQQEYQAILKGGKVQVKEAHSFEYRGGRHRAWELKYQNKDRMYFFTVQGAPRPESRLLSLALFHHKNDQKTPQRIRDYCESLMKPILAPGANIEVIKE